MEALPFSTLAQVIGLVLTLFTGWLFGLAMAPRGNRWREYYHDEELAHARFRGEVSDELRDKHKRVRELEAAVAGRANAHRGAPVAAAPITASSPGPIVAPPPSGANAHIPASPGWTPDSLQRIRGVDSAREQRMHELGIKTYREIEKMSPEDESALEQRLVMTPGAIAQARWREQAALLAAGHFEEHQRRFG